MSHEPYPRTDRARPGSTPAEPPGGQAELERQRAETERGEPRQPSGDHPDEDEEDDEDAEEDAAEADANYEPVSPQDTVPEEIADEAERSLDPRTEPRDRDRTPGEEPMRRAPSSGEVAHPPSDDA